LHLLTNWPVAARRPDTPLTSSKVCHNPSPPAMSPPAPISIYRGVFNQTDGRMPSPQPQRMLLPVPPLSPAPVMPSPLGPSAVECQKRGEKKTLRPTFRTDTATQRQYDEPGRQTDSTTRSKGRVGGTGGLNVDLQYRAGGTARGRSVADTAFSVPTAATATQPRVQQPPYGCLVRVSGKKYAN